MQLEEAERVADLVASAMECAPSERAQFLSDVCGDDFALREEAESFLRFEESARDFLEIPAYEVATETKSEEAPAAIGPPSEYTEPIDLTAQIEPDTKAFEAEPIPEPEPGPIPAAELQPTPEPEPEHHEILATEVPREIKREVEAPPKFESADRVSIPRLDLYDAARIVAVGLLLAAVIVLVGARRKVEKLWRERNIAQAERLRAENMSNFLQRILSFSNESVTSVWPVPQREEATISEMLDQAAPRIEKEFASQPDLRARMLRVIGSAYAAQGRYDAAEKNLRAAFGAQVRLHDEQNAEAVSTMLELGILSAHQLKADEAQRLLEKAISFYRQERQINSSQYSAARLALALGYLGEMRFRQGETAAGLSHLSEALQISFSANLKGIERSVLSFNKGALGAAFVILGETGKGEALLREAISEYRSVSSEPPWETGELVMMLGVAALSKDEPDEAQKYLHESETILRHTLGDKNLYLVTNLNYQAAALAVKGDFKAAEEKARECLALSKAVSPDNKLPWTEPLRTLGNILMLAGQTREGEDYYRQALAICERQSTRNYSLIVPLKIQLCHLLLAQKRLTEAENLAFEAQSEARRHFDEENAVRKAATNNLIQIYKKQGKDEVAETVK
jgi:tetratricopeptide (TPR) repeat protein